MSISANLPNRDGLVRRGGPLRVAQLCLALTASTCTAEDVVHVSIGEGTRSRVRLTGEVLDYSGQTLLMKLPGGVERAFPAERVHAIETTRLSEHLAGDKLARERQPEAAIARYRQALEKEERRWVRREILSHLVRCSQDAGDTLSAVQFFTLLVQSDPRTPYFDCIPLVWLPRETPAAVVQAAQQWMSRETDPAGSLIGASQLLTTSHRAAALERLRSLSFGQEVRVAALARGQMWRVTFATASDIQVDNWAADVEKIPENLRAGPYYVLGAAWAAKHQPARAALAYLRVPLLYPGDRALAGRALLEGGRELEKIGQKAEAATLYREVLDTHAQGPLAEEAQQRLAALRKDEG